MSARVWTVPELNLVHPLPEPDGKITLYPWAWRIDDDGPVAHEVGPAEPDEVWCKHGLLESGSGNPPSAVALAVILASTGRDSFAWMASHLDAEMEVASRTERSLRRNDRKIAMANQELGRRHGLDHGRAMLIRGRVEVER